MKRTFKDEPEVVRVNSQDINFNISEELQQKLNDFDA